MNYFKLCNEMTKIDKQRDYDYYYDNNVYFFPKKKKKNKRKELEEKIWG